MKENRQIVLIDFGLSTTWRPCQRMKTFCGSPEYAAPGSKNFYKIIYAVLVGTP